VFFFALFACPTGEPVGMETAVDIPAGRRPPSQTPPS
jgi:hypothetical protein